ncbi:iron ABC transporter substrate-binding protein [Corallincola holothuriorum]|uniref:Iron ABC transporter substrate-binding protein n=1 Tax=Corallincola holothuriorum TaxID=2282215 RepID=A0A368NLJ0_9GAMM|nr:Fe(3+) ABC transporter substrate-binding protein [Corallincola holothuriorum]RCU51026.1 iron ABC transporter substrate-binding protein [Corallincola holothuriorum]
MNKALLTTTITLFLLFSGLAQAASSEVNVYSSRKEALVKPLLDEFTAETGIKVNLVTGKDDALITRLQKEGKRSPADLLITADAGRLYRAKQANLLQVINSDAVNSNVPAHLRDAENYWVGLTMRARPIFYVKEKVQASELSTYEALTASKWAGRICIRSSSNIYNQSLIASVIAADGETAAEAFVAGLVKNFARPPAGGDTDQLKAAAAGMCDIAIANTYYFGRLATSNKAQDQQVVNKLGVFWPNQQGRGTHVNVSGIGITQAAKNVPAATQLIEFMLTQQAQTWYAEVNNEYPVVTGVAPSATLTSWGEFKADATNLTKLGELNRRAVEVMDRAGWK